MRETCDPSSLFDQAPAGERWATAWGSVPSLVPAFGEVLEVRNAARGEAPFAGSFTVSCWQALAEVLPAGAVQTCAGWWTGWNMAADIAAHLGSEPRRCTLVAGSDLDWDIWACTAADAQRAGTRDGHFQSPSLWFAAGARPWLVLGFPTTATSYVSASDDVVSGLLAHPSIEGVRAEMQR